MGYTPDRDMCARLAYSGTDKNYLSCRSSVTTQLASSGSWMTLTSIIVIGLFMAITWLDLMMGNKDTRVDLPEVEICTRQVDNPPSYASVERDVHPPNYSSDIVEKL